MLYISIVISIILSAILILISNSYESSDNPKIIRFYKKACPGYMVTVLADKLGYFIDEGIEKIYINREDGLDDYSSFESGIYDASPAVASDVYLRSVEQNKINAKIALITKVSNNADAIVKTRMFLQQAAK